MTHLELEGLAAKAMQDFDFEKVRAHMEQADWRWKGIGDDPSSTPSTERIQSVARYLLTQAIWDPRPSVTVATGGLLAIKADWGLSLHFCIANTTQSR